MIERLNAFIELVDESLTLGNPYRPERKAVQRRLQESDPIVREILNAVRPGLGGYRRTAFSGWSAARTAAQTAIGILKEHEDLRARLAPDAAVLSVDMLGRDENAVERKQRVHQIVSATGDSGRAVFVVHGRNEPARRALFAFLRAIGLQPIEWSQARALTGLASPYIGEILDAAFSNAQAVVVLLTPDEVVHLRPEYATGADDPELQPGTQARPNVLFEAGMALARDPSRTILVEIGAMRQFSDIAGRYAVRMSNQAAQRNELAVRLQTAGCLVDLSGSDWLEAGNFQIPAPPRSTMVAPPAEGADAPVRHHRGTRGASLRGRQFPRTAGERRQLISDQPNGWEYLLWSSILLDGKERLEVRWREHQRRFARPSSIVINHENVSTFPNSVITTLQMLIDRINAIFSPDAKGQAFGAPGEVGNPAEIDRLASDLIEVYEEFLDWSARIRGAQVSGKYARLTEIAARIPDRPIVLIRGFIEDFAAGMIKVQEGELLDLHLTLTLDLDSSVLDDFLHEYERVM